jgi:hypothetical protein
LSQYHVAPCPVKRLVMKREIAPPKILGRITLPISVEHPFCPNPLPVTTPVDTAEEIEAKRITTELRKRVLMPDSTTTRWDAKGLTGYSQPRTPEEHAAFLMSVFDPEEVFDFSNPDDVFAGGLWICWMRCCAGGGNETHPDSAS